MFGVELPGLILVQFRDLRVILELLVPKVLLVLKA